MLIESVSGLLSGCFFQSVLETSHAYVAPLNQGIGSVYSTFPEIPVLHKVMTRLLLLPTGPGISSPVISASRTSHSLKLETDLNNREKVP